MIEDQIFFIMRRVPEFLRGKQARRNAYNTLLKARPDSESRVRSLR